MPDQPPDPYSELFNRAAEAEKAARDARRSARRATISLVISIAALLIGFVALLHLPR